MLYQWMRFFLFKVRYFVTLVGGCWKIIHVSQTRISSHFSLINGCWLIVIIHFQAGFLVDFKYNCHIEICLLWKISAYFLGILFWVISFPLLKNSFPHEHRRIECDAPHKCFLPMENTEGRVDPERIWCVHLEYKQLLHIFCL